MSKRIELLTRMAETGCTSPTVSTELHEDGSETCCNEFDRFDPNGVPDEGGEFVAWDQADEVTRKPVSDLLKYKYQGKAEDWPEPHVVIVVDKATDEKRRHFVFMPAR